MTPPAFRGPAAVPAAHAAPRGARAGPARRRPPILPDTGRLQHHHGQYQRQQHRWAQCRPRHGIRRRHDPPRRRKLRIPDGLAGSAGGYRHPCADGGESPLRFRLDLGLERPSGRRPRLRQHADDRRLARGDHELQARWLGPVPVCRPHQGRQQPHRRRRRRPRHVPRKRPRLRGDEQPGLGPVLRPDARRRQLVQRPHREQHALRHGAPPLQRRHRDPCRRPADVRQQPRNPARHRHQRQLHLRRPVDGRHRQPLGPGDLPGRADRRLPQHHHRGEPRRHGLAERHLPVRRRRRERDPQQHAAGRSEDHRQERRLLGHADLQQRHPRRDRRERRQRLQQLRLFRRSQQPGPPEQPVRERRGRLVLERVRPEGGLAPRIRHDLRCPGAAAGAPHRRRSGGAGGTGGAGQRRPLAPGRRRDDPRRHPHHPRPPRQRRRSRR